MPPITLIRKHQTLFGDNAKPQFKQLTRVAIVNILDKLDQAGFKFTMLGVCSSDSSQFLTRLKNELVNFLRDARLTLAAGPDPDSPRFELLPWLVVKPYFRAPHFRFDVHPKAGPEKFTESWIKSMDWPAYQPQQPVLVLAPHYGDISGSLTNRPYLLTENITHPELRHNCLGGRVMHFAGVANDVMCNPE
ncbi:hypothetical protein K435DRAFT_866565, partial [Dendrothele bispora CBS 962.96]